MKLGVVGAPEFDLAKTLASGQVFHWSPHERGFVGTIGERAVYVEASGSEVRFAGAPAKTIARYFALDHPLADICRSFPRDERMMAAAEFCRGLRIIRQPKWECLATFICSSMKQVAHIRQISLALRERFGTEKRIDGIRAHAFPTAARIGQLSERKLRECKLGYRAKNLLATARRVATGEVDLEALRDLSDDDLRARLCDLPGVGAKVANCVMLFAYERLRAFPIDVWIARVLKEQYFPRRRKLTAETLRKFSAAYFGEHGGYAQQYLFHHARMTARRRASAGPIVQQKFRAGELISGPRPARGTL